MTENVLYSDMDPFENPEHLPLEKLKLKVRTEGVVEFVNALDRRWAEDRYFLHYEAPQLYTDDGSEIGGAKEYWMELVSYIIDDMKWLLSLPFYRFWSNVVYNTSILDALVSFLQDAPPFYALDNFPNYPEMMDLLETLRRNVLVIFARLVTNKETPVEYMSNPFLGNLLYENYIFTVPIIFDLCQLYGRENAKAVEKILYCLFTLEPSYNDDLQKTVPCLIEAFENVEVKFENCPRNYNGEPIALPKRRTGSEELTLFNLEDMLLYILDISSTLNVVLKNCPSVVNIFHREDFTKKIISIYESTIPEMYRRLGKLATNENMPKLMELKHRLDVTRIELIHLFRAIIFEPILSIHERLNTITEAEKKEHVKEYFDFISNAISEKEFITDYNQFHPVDQDLQYLSNICPEEVDTIKYEYIVNSMNATVGTPNTTPISNYVPEAVAGPSGIQNSQTTTFANNVNVTNKKDTAVKKTPIEMACLVSEVKDILHDLNEGFIEMCLHHYNYDTAAVLNAVLEESLPPILSELKSSGAAAANLQLEPPIETMIDMGLATGVERINVFDDQEVHELKREYIEVPKEYIKRNFSLIPDEYDDERDDTYDSCDVHVNTQDDPVEVDSRRFTTPRVLYQKQKKESDDEPDMEEERTTAEQNGKDHFLQNPAELRAKAEQRLQSKRGGKSGTNVVGKPRGQGQDKETVVSRQQKNTNKATRANHNRRSGAEWKRRQGMVPS